MCAICKEYWPEYYEPIPVDKIMDQQEDIEKAVKKMATDTPIGGPPFKVGDYIRIKQMWSTNKLKGTIQKVVRDGSGEGILELHKSYPVIEPQAGSEGSVRVQAWEKAEQVNFHRYAPEFTLYEVRRFKPQSVWGPTEEVVILQDKKGRTYMVPVEALAKKPEEKKLRPEPKDNHIVRDRWGYVWQRSDEMAKGSSLRWFRVGADIGHEWEFIRESFL